VATSNRVPEELAKASGIEFVPPSAQSMLSGIGHKFQLGRSGEPIRKRRGLPGATDFAKFLEVLKARCDV